MNDDRNHRPRQTSGEIAAIVARYRTSGLRLERFAREHGIPPGRLHYWLYQKQPDGCSRRRSWSTKPTVAPVFQEIQLPAKPDSVGTWAAEISLPCGVAIRFSPVASAEWIGSVVQVLQRPC